MDQMTNEQVLQSVVQKIAVTGQVRSGLANYLVWSHTMTGKRQTAGLMLEKSRCQ